MIDRLTQSARDLHDDVVAWRRHLHAHPELSFQEVETARFVAGKLDEWAIEHQTGVAKTGIVGLIRGTDPDSRCIALRADMDALPIRETGDKAYISTNEGVMHACGHDVHTASLLGAAKLIHDHRDQLRGTIKLIFQPSEERSPGGASVMIDEGVLEDPAVDMVLGMHVSPDLPTGTIGYCPGPFMASANEIHLTVEGAGGHAAFPHRLVDPIGIAMRILDQLNETLRKRNRPDAPFVLSFGRFIADGSTNVIPDRAEVSGTMRSFDEDFRQWAVDRIPRIAEATATAMGGSCTVEMPPGYPPLINDDALTDRVRDLAEEAFTRDVVQRIPLRLSAEDFGFFTQRMPSCFYRIGTGNAAKSTTHGLHTPPFDIDEDALKTSVPLMAWLAMTV